MFVYYIELKKKKKKEEEKKEGWMIIPLVDSQNLL